MLRNRLYPGWGYAAVERRDLRRRFRRRRRLLRLRRLAAERVAVTPLAPDEYLNYRPQTVLTPFTGSPVARYPIGELAAVTGAQWVRDRLASVDLGAHRAHTTDGQSLVYDALLLAPGAQERKPSPHVALFTDRTKGQTFRGIVEEIDAGAITSLTLIEPAARRGRSRSTNLRCLPRNTCTIAGCMCRSRWSPCPRIRCTRSVRWSVPRCSACCRTRA